MRVVFDTNVILAAFITHGTSAEVFDHCLTHHTIICSPFILHEIEDKHEVLDSLIIRFRVVR